jgi:hypothetical protein
MQRSDSSRISDRVRSLHLSTLPASILTRHIQGLTDMTRVSDPHAWFPPDTLRSFRWRVRISGISVWILVKLGSVIAVSHVNCFSHFAGKEVWHTDHEDTSCNGCGSSSNTPWSRLGIKSGSGGTFAEPAAGWLYRPDLVLRYGMEW